MHFDSSTSSLSRSISYPSLKRSYSQSAATAAALSSPQPSGSNNGNTPSWPATGSVQRPGKVPKISTSQTASSSLEGRSSPKRRPGASTSSSQAEMPPPSTSRSRSSGRVEGRHGLVGSVSAGPSSGLSTRHRKGSKIRSNDRRQRLDQPFHDEPYIIGRYKVDSPSLPPFKTNHEENPKSTVMNFYRTAYEEVPHPEFMQGVVDVAGTLQETHRCTVNLPQCSVVGVGDAREKKRAEHLAFLSALYQIHAQGILYAPKKMAQLADVNTTVTLSDGTTEIGFDKARSFMDYYCRRYSFGKPDIAFEENGQRKSSTWDAIMTVGGKRIGLGSGSSKKAAQIACYLDVTKYLESCDPQLWATYVEAAKTGKDLGMAPKVVCVIGDRLGEEIKDLCYDLKWSVLYRNRPAIGSQKTGLDDPEAIPSPLSSVPPRRPSKRPDALKNKSQRLLQRQQAYLADPKLEIMRRTRMSLPVYTRADEVVKSINQNDVMILMAATGSGKTTQVPQLILDDYIARGEGANCNVICTQPRRIAALSVADRVAKERGEVAGRGTVGYQVRFDSKPPEEHGSITFCTTGVFLKKMQTALVNSGREPVSLDDVTHVVVDEVHERDVDTDLLLVVLKRLLADRKARNVPIKIVLMSATIDPTLFQRYFLDEKGLSAPIVEVPGRSFPVVKHFLEDYLPVLRAAPEASWVFNQDSTLKYIRNEVSPDHIRALGMASTWAEPRSSQLSGDLELPYPLIVLIISHVLRTSSSGHVLVFLPGWDEIVAVQRCLQDLAGPFARTFTNPKEYRIHLLHSTIPLAEQQLIFEPPPEGVRRIILATNIAETSVTIPDVVYVVDTAKIKEVRYDPDRHMSALVSAWVGASNLNQRAGRAGRHRPGEYFGVLGRERADQLSPYQTVEMKRVDLSNVVMHVKAHDFPGMTVQEVLAATIEPPASERVTAAIKDLHMVGALDGADQLTSLGRVLLQLPVEVQMGRLVLLGCFFRCLDSALTLAAILTNRDPFMSPMHLKVEAQARKDAFTTSEYRSDALATLRAYKAWAAMQENGEYLAANRFCVDNFLSKPTLLMIQKIRTHLLQSLHQSGVIAVSGGGTVPSTAERQLQVPSELNHNANSLPLLGALVAIASQPKFAVRTGEKTFRTAQDKMTFIHPSSVNNRKREVASGDVASSGEKQLFAYAEKRQNVSAGGSNAQMNLITTTRLEPLVYMLFGAYRLEVTERGLDCDGWLPVVGNLDALDDIQRLKVLMESCFLRVFEGITMAKRRRGRAPYAHREEEHESDYEDDRAGKELSMTEVKELDLMTRDIVRILNHYHEEYVITQPRQNSRPATPMGSPGFLGGRLPGGSQSGRSTPFTSRYTSFNSRPGTPSGLSSWM